MYSRLLIFLFVCCFSKAQSQTFTAPGGPIPDDGTVVVFELLVNGLAPAIDDQNFGLESVCVDITHTWDSDVSISLEAPDGTLIPLFSGIGGDLDGFQNTCLSNNADETMFQAPYPFTGTYRPFGDMGQINNGQNPNGTWKLIILDTYAFADAGTLYSWSVTFGPNPCHSFPFNNSNLPVVKIFTGGQIIPNEPKIDALMEVYDKGWGQINVPAQDDPTYAGPIGIELHGNSTQGFPKKNLRLETRDSLGKDLDVSLIGMPATSDYVLMANFSDKTLMRNALSYELSRRLGHWASRTRFCEVLIDGVYQGVYVLMEKIKRGEERVDVNKLTAADTSGVELTGGYICKIDWNSSPGWNSQFNQPNSPNVYTYFQHEYPKWDEMAPVQHNYIVNFVDSFEVALHGPEFQDPATGWRRFGDERSFMDFLFVNEMAKNVDGYRLSTYFYKERDDAGGKINMGPLWDFDLAWFNADYCDAWSTSGWAYDINYVCGDAGVPFWWERLEADTLFQQNMACRWQSLRAGVLSNAAITSAIDSMATVVAEAQLRNFEYWDILGIYVWPNPQPLPDTYEGEVQKLKNWTLNRLNWLDYTFGLQLPELHAQFSAAPLNALSWQFESAAEPARQYFWDFGDGQTAVGPQAQHQFAGTGTYTVTLVVSTPFGCSEQLAQIIHIVDTGVEALPFEKLAVYPNPAQSKISFLVPESAGRLREASLKNQLGQSISLPLTGSGELYELDLHLLTPGMYEMAVRNGKQQYIGRFVKM